MEQNEVDAFFTPTNFDKAPEVGSRVLHNILIDNNGNVLSQWTNVQADNYEYSVSVGFGILTVRILIWNYLAVEVIWDN